MQVLGQINQNVNKTALHRAVCLKFTTNWYNGSSVWDKDSLGVAAVWVYGQVDRRFYPYLGKYFIQRCTLTQVVLQNLILQLCFSIAAGRRVNFPNWMMMNVSKLWFIFEADILLQEQCRISKYHIWLRDDQCSL